MRKIIHKNANDAESQLTKLRLAKATAGNSLIVEGAMSKIHLMRSKLIKEGYGITVVTTYSVLSAIADSNKLEDILEVSKRITIEDFIKKVKELKGVYTITSDN